MHQIAGDEGAVARHQRAERVAGADRADRPRAIAKQRGEVRFALRSASQARTASLVARPVSPGKQLAGQIGG